MFSLAGVRFRNVLARDGGPVERIDISDFRVLGRRMFHANALLQSGIAARRNRYVIYGNVDGSGTAASPLVASHMAISEAMERWAYRAKAHATDAADYGFDVDRSSTGMAGFPGLLARQARANAWHEAVERFSMMAWWDGQLGGTLRETEWTGVKAVQIDAMESSVCAVVLFKACDPGFYSYGHAAAGSFHAACEKAIVELARSEYVMRRYLVADGMASSSARPVPTHLFERRFLYFSTPLGHARFLARVREGREIFRPLAERVVVFDGEIPGPWGDYASVWRIVLKPAVPGYLDDREDFFFW